MRLAKISKLYIPSEKFVQNNISVQEKNKKLWNAENTFESRFPSTGPIAAASLRCGSTAQSLFARSRSWTSSWLVAPPAQTSTSGGVSGFGDFRAYAGRRNCVEISQECRRVVEWQRPQLGEVLFWTVSKTFLKCFQNLSSILHFGSCPRSFFQQPSRRAPSASRRPRKCWRRAASPASCCAPRRRDSSTRPAARGRGGTWGPVCQISENSQYVRQIRRFC